MASPIEIFPALEAIPGYLHGFIIRDPEIDVATTDKKVALDRLSSSHEQAWRLLGFDSLWTAEQIHGSEIADVSHGPTTEIEGVDGLLASDHVGLGIYVADCCAVFIVDPEQRVHSLVHSGRKGSELGIAPKAIRRMVAEYGSDPSNLIVQLSPCVRPPVYEIDFAAIIRETCAAEGVPTLQIHDPGTCTGSNLERYYSYRVEKGATGRMLAVSAFVR